MYMYIAQDDEDLAQEYLQMAITQYDATKDSSRHCSITHKYLSETGSLRQHIDAFLQTKHKSPVFVLHGNRMKMIRTNEISVESLHRQGSQIQKQQDFYSAPSLSFGLHAKEMLSFFPPQKFADCMAEVRNEQAVVKAFGFEKHQVLVDFEDNLTLDGTTLRTGRAGHYRLVRQVFYRCDPQSLFQNFEIVEAAYNEKRKLWKKDDEEREADPIKALADAPDDAKLDGVLCRYGLKHLKAVCDEDHVYSFPRGHVSGLKTLAQSTNDRQEQ